MPFLFPNPLLQHRIQALPQNSLDPYNPSLRLPLHALIIVFLQLTDKRQHLRQQRQPLFPQPLRQALLALHGRQPHMAIVGAHVFQYRGVYLSVVFWRIGGDGQLGDGGNEVGSRGKGGGASELRDEGFRNGCEVGGDLPELYRLC